MTEKVIPCGTKVKINLSSTEGFITAVSIRFEAVAYEVSYFNNGDYKQIWLNSVEFKVSNGSVNKIGFKHD